MAKPNPVKIIKKYGVKTIYNAYVYSADDPDRELMSLEPFKKNKTVLPIAILNCPASKLERLRKVNPFFQSATRYFSIPNMPLLTNLVNELEPAFRNLCTMVIWEKGCQFYFDIDFDASDKKRIPEHMYNDKGLLPEQLRDKRAVISAVWYFFAEAFKKAFGREPRGMVPDSNADHKVEFDACINSKFSLHLHQPCEGLKRVKQHRLFVHDYMFPLIRERAIEGDPRAIRLTYWDPKPAQAYRKLFPLVEGKGYWRTFIDHTVYTEGRVFRYPGNCKPGGAMLVIVDNPPRYRNFIDQLRVATISRCLPPENELLSITEENDSSSEAPVSVETKTVDLTDTNETSDATVVDPQIPPKQHANGISKLVVTPNVVTKTGGTKRKAPSITSLREIETMRQQSDLVKGNSKITVEFTEKPHNGDQSSVDKKVQRKKAFVDREVQQERMKMRELYFRGMIATHGEYDGIIKKPDWEEASTKWGPELPELQKLKWVKWLDSVLKNRFKQMVLSAVLDPFTANLIRVFESPLSAYVGRFCVEHCVFRGTSIDHVWPEHSEIMPLLPPTNVHTPVGTPQCIWQFHARYVTNAVVLRCQCTHLSRDRYLQFNISDCSFINELFAEQSKPKEKLDVFMVLNSVESLSHVV